MIGREGDELREEADRKEEKGAEEARELRDLGDKKDALVEEEKEIRSK